MSILTIVKNIKQIHNKYILLVKLGKFYYCYGRDAYIVSYFFGYKLNLIDETTFSCGFPSESLNKVIAKLEKEKINYMIVDRRNNYDVEEKENYNKLNTYDKYFEEAKEKIGVKLRIQKISNYLIKNSNNKEIKNILIKIEKILQENKLNKD